MFYLSIPSKLIFTKLYIENIINADTYLYCSNITSSVSHVYGQCWPLRPLRTTVIAGILSRQLVKHLGLGCNGRRRPSRRLINQCAITPYLRKKQNTGILQRSSTSAGCSHAYLTYGEFPSSYVLRILIQRMP